MVERPQVYLRSNLHHSSDSLITRGEVERWPHLQDLPLRHAAIEDVTLLSGQDCPGALIPLTAVPDAQGEPYAIRTCLSWTVNGLVSKQEKLPPTSHSTHGESLDRLCKEVDKSQHLESDEEACKHEKGVSMCDKMELCWTSDINLSEARSNATTGSAPEGTCGLMQSVWLRVRSNESEHTPLPSLACWGECCASSHRTNTDMPPGYAVNYKCKDNPGFQ